MAKDKPTPRPRAETPKGFRDCFGAEVAARNAMLARIAGVYRMHGFDPLETSAVETVEALGKFLPDVDRPNEGVFAWQDEDERWLALRYDLTAPRTRRGRCTGAGRPGDRRAAGAVCALGQPRADRALPSLRVVVPQLGVARPGEPLEAHHVGSSRGQRHTAVARHESVIIAVQDQHRHRQLRCPRHDVELREVDRGFQADERRPAG